MYLKNNNGQLKPYSVEQLRRDNPNISFPAELTNETLAEYGVFRVVPSPPPAPSLDKKIVEGVPVLVDGVWTQVWEEIPCTYEEHLQRVLDARAAEYPPMSDYLDGIVKNDAEQVQRYIDACLSVKTKYPKPQK